MRILLVNRFVHRVGGVEVYLRNLVPHLLERGHEVGFLCQEMTARGASEVNPGPGPTWHCGMGKGVGEQIRAWNPGLLFVHQQVDEGLLAPLVRDFPSVWFAHAYGGLCISGSRCWRTPTARPCGRPFDGRCLLHFYPHRCGGVNPLTMWRLYWHQQGVLRLLRSMDLVVTHSEHMESLYHRQGFSADRVRVLPFFVAGGPVGRGGPRSGAPGGPLRLLFLGRFDPLKGGAWLLRALPAVARGLGRSIELTMAGDGPEASRWKRMADGVVREHPGIQIRFPGWVDGEERVRALQGAELVVVPSIWPEPFGMTGVEAAFLGVPAVAFDVGGIRAWLDPGRTGELAGGDPPTAEGLAAAIQRAVADPEHYARLSDGAARRAASFGPAVHMEALEASFRTALERRCRRRGDGADGTAAVVAVDRGVI